MPQTNRPGACPLAALLLSLLALLLLPAAAHAAPRVALLIGNQAYTQGGLRYPAQDVGHIKAALLDIGFQPRDVVVLLDADQKAVKRALSAFGERARGAEVAFLYYSGHATQARGQNWLIPIGAEIRNEADYEIEAVSAQAALAQLQEAAPALSVVVLDACRDNPVAVTKSGTKGLGRMDAGASTVLAYATSPNDTAADNGLYAQVLAAQLRMPGKEILDVFRDTGAEVRRRTKDSAKPQAPRLSEVDVPRRFYLASTPPEPKPPVVDGELQQWTSALRANTEAAYADYLRAYPNGAYAGAARNALAAIKPQPELQPELQPRRGPAPAVDCSFCPQMVVVPAGSFMMGSPAGEPGRGSDEGPQRLVNVAGFELGKYEVTVQQYLACVADGGCAEPEWREAGSRYHHSTGSDDHYRKLGDALTAGPNPIVGVSWNDAQRYAQWLSSKTGRRYRLPSEAEWEYAARAGSSAAYPWGADIGRNRANCAGCGSRWDNKQTAPVGSFEPNAFGLHDMHSNVREWVQDIWHDSYFGAPGDANAWMSGGDQSWRVLRGGFWGSAPQILRSADRDWSTPGSRGSGTGFRIARTY